jgi:hypothetical protein
MGMQDRDWYRDLMRERRRNEEKSFLRGRGKWSSVRPLLYQLLVWISVLFLLYKAFKLAGFH